MSPGFTRDRKAWQMKAPPGRGSRFPANRHHAVVPESVEFAGASARSVDPVTLAGRFRLHLHDLVFFLRRGSLEAIGQVGEELIELQSFWQVGQTAVDLQVIGEEPIEELVDLEKLVDQLVATFTRVW